MGSITSVKKNIERLIARRVSEDFEKVCKQLIRDFYSDYSPTTYSRTDDYRSGVEINQIKGTHIGGVRINNNVSAHKEASGELIFDLIWNQGIRGLPATGKNGWVNPYFMTTSYSIPEFGIGGSSPDSIMTQMPDAWLDKRETFIDTVIWSELDKLDILDML